MSSFADITIGGRLSQDAVVSTYGNDQIKITLTIPVDNVRDRNNTAWYNIALFGRQAEIAMKLLNANALRKGQELIVNGRFTPSNWTDRNGVIRQSLDVTCDSFHLMGKKEQPKTVEIQDVISLPVSDFTTAGF